MEVYYTGNGDICPVCGGRIKHPYTGEVTSEQIEEDMNCCQWMEVCDEGDGCLGLRRLAVLFQSMGRFYYGRSKSKH